MRIGLSYWGFLGNGIVDSPDAGRFYRPMYVKALLDKGHEVYVMQQNRDDNFIFDNRLNFCEDFHGKSLPKLDILYLEWRWPIEGRNINCKNPNNYTPDLDRQIELMEYYHDKTDTKIIIHDEDRKLSFEEELKWSKAIIADWSLILKYQTRKRIRMMFPYDYNRLNEELPRINYNKDHLYCYLGNNYERDRQFKTYIGDVSRFYNGKVHVWGNWTKYPEQYFKLRRQYPYVMFHDRIDWNDAIKIRKQFCCEVYLSKDEYSQYGCLSPRYIENIHLKVPILMPKEFYGSKLFVNDNMLLSEDKYYIVAKVYELSHLYDFERAQLIYDQTQKFIELKKYFDINVFCNMFERIYNNEKIVDNDIEIGA